MKETQEEMFELVRQYKISDLSRKEFSKQHGISLHALRNWITVYNKAFPIYQEDPGKPGFHIVQFEKELADAAYEITYPNGVQLKCKSGTSMLELQSLIQLW